MKKYVFYDSESIDIKHKYSFTFGYVVTDENFNVIMPREDIVFNPDIPKQDWDWWAYRKLLMKSYPQKQIISAKTFPHFYNKIRKLFQGDDVLCIGFEINEDIKYLLSNCERYKLEPINFRYIDLREILRHLTGKKPNSLSYEYIRYLHVPDSGAHRSDIDAEMTMLVLKEALRKSKKTLDDILEEKEDLLGACNGFCYGFKDNIFDIKNPREPSHENVGGIRARKLKEGKEDWLLKGSVNNIMFTRFLDYVQPVNEMEQFLKGKKVNNSLNYEMYHYQNMLKLIQMIADAGGTYVKKASLADIFVKNFEESFDEEGNLKPCTRYNNVMRAIEQDGKEIEILEFDDFLAMFNLDREKLDEMPQLDIEYLKDKKYSRKS